MESVVARRRQRVEAVVLRQDRVRAGLKQHAHNLCVAVVDRGHERRPAVLPWEVWLRPGVKELPNLAAWRVAGADARGGCGGCGSACDKKR